MSSLLCSVLHACPAWGLHKGPKGKAKNNVAFLKHPETSATSSALSRTPKEEELTRRMVMAVQAEHSA